MYPAPSNICSWLIIRFDYVRPPYSIEYTNESFVKHQRMYTASLVKQIYLHISALQVYTDDLYYDEPRPWILFN